MSVDVILKAIFQNLSIYKFINISAVENKIFFLISLKGKNNKNVIGFCFWRQKDLYKLSKYIISD